MIPYTTQSLVIGYHSRVIFLPANKPHTDMTPKILNTALKANHININIRLSEEQKINKINEKSIYMKRRNILPSDNCSNTKIALGYKCSHYVGKELWSTGSWFELKIRNQIKYQYSKEAFNTVEGKVST